MKIVVDDKIPYIKGLIERLADEVVYLAGADICATDVRDADVLLVRTRTHCDRALLEGSRVQLIVTATIGYDHIDTDYLHEAGIEWHNCPGCNATSVAQYVRNVLYLLEQERGVCLTEATLGIVGVGHVGTAVWEACRPLVGRVLLNDPPRESRQDEKSAEDIPQPPLFSPLEQLMEECDILSFHTPLVREGRYPTFHLADDAFLDRLSRCPVLINSARGEVVDNEALERALDEGRVREAIIDTWENEPHLARTLLNKVYIGTPHIAGYSADGKANATRMSLEAIAMWMARRGDVEALQVFSSLTVAPPPVPEELLAQARAEGISLDEVNAQSALLLYDPRRDSKRLKDDPDGFEAQRGKYPLRRERGMA